MTRWKIKVFFIITLVIIAAAGVYIALGNMDYFNIREVEYNASGSSVNIADDVHHILTGLRGRNLFRLNTKKVISQLMQCEGVSSVEIKKYFPDKAIVSVRYSDFLIKVKTDDGYYFADGQAMIPVSRERYVSYSALPVVEMSSSYADFIVKWGYDEGFSQMLELAGRLGSKSLITSIKYDNNNSDRFGRLYIILSSPDAELCVREPVTYQRLDEALSLLVEDGKYDLNANALVKRT